MLDGAAAVVVRVLGCRTVGVIKARAGGIFLADVCAAVVALVGFPCAGRQGSGGYQDGDERFHGGFLFVRLVVKRQKAA